MRKNAFVVLPDWKIVTMTTLYSYVVDHDHGFAPNPYHGICTLVHCKFGGHGGKRNIVEMVKVGDWILGSGGVSAESAGNGKIVFLMRVDEKLSFDNYLQDVRFIGRDDHEDFGGGNKYALVSTHYFYFGKNAIDTSEFPEDIPSQNLFKTGANYRSDYPISALNKLIDWFERSYLVGMHGDPVTSSSALIQLRKRGKLD